MYNIFRILNLHPYVYFITSSLYCCLHIVSIFNTLEAGSDKLHRFSKFHDSAISA